MICHLGNNKIKFGTETRLNKILVGVVEWVGDIDHFTELKEVWVQLEGIPLKWCSWQVFAHMASGHGLMLEVD
jgi:hypothetical protein